MAHIVLFEKNSASRVFNGQRTCDWTFEPLKNNFFQPKKILAWRKILIPAKLSNKFCMEAKFNLFSPNRVTCFFCSRNRRRRRCGRCCCWYCCCLRWWCWCWGCRFHCCCVGDGVGVAIVAGVGVGAVIVVVVVVAVIAAVGVGVEATLE